MKQQNDLELGEHLFFSAAIPGIFACNLILPLLHSHINADVQSVFLSPVIQGSEGSVDVRRKGGVASLWRHFRGCPAQPDAHGSPGTAAGRNPEIPHQSERWRPACPFRVPQVNLLTFAWRHLRQCCRTTTERDFLLKKKQQPPSSCWVLFKCEHSSRSNGGTYFFWNISDLHFILSSWAVSASWSCSGYFSQPESFYIKEADWSSYAWGINTLLKEKVVNDQLDVQGSAVHCCAMRVLRWYQMN